MQIILQRLHFGLERQPDLLTLGFQPDLKNISSSSLSQLSYMAPRGKDCHTPTPHFTAKLGQTSFKSLLNRYL